MANRNKKPAELHEGPEAYENFRRLTSRILQAGRPASVIEDTTTEEEVVTDTQYVVSPTKRQRHK